MIEKIQTLITNEDFPALYEIADDDSLDLDSKQELHQMLVDLATEKVHEKIADKCLLDFDDKSEQFVLRVLYENAIGAFEAGESYESQEAFALLASVSNSKFFQKALRKHLLALLRGVSFETFIQEWIASEAPKHFFVSSFSKEVEKMFVQEEADLSKQTQRYTKLFR